MGDLKELLRTLETGSTDYAPAFSEDELEVYADSVRQALELAANELHTEISNLDYDVLEKGNKGFFGIGRLPYHLVIRPLQAGKEYDDLDELDQKIGRVDLQEIKVQKLHANKDGDFKIRVTKTGVWLIVSPPVGKGRKVDVESVNGKLFALRINNADGALVQKAVSEASGKGVKVGEWIPNPEYDGNMRVEITEDEMQAIVYFNAPRFSGRHMELDDITSALKSAGVMVGIHEEKIKQYLDEMNYSQPLVAAEGAKAKNGASAYVDFKVNVDKSNISLKEIEGQVDFKDLDLIENVVVGQLLAVKIPAEPGVPGRTLYNRILPAKSGKDVQIKHGKGTILSEDGLELTAEINGQVVYRAGKLSIEPIYHVPGDVDLSTGNIVFLGSVLISGSVQDNFSVKAAGNIEVKGSVQKAFLEAEGDIIVSQGINGRDEAKIESTGGSVFAKFVQRANLIAEKNIVVAEEVLHAKLAAGKAVICNGKRAQIVGGSIVAGDEVNARQIGAESYIKTEVTVGMNPKVLQQINELQTTMQKSEEELQKINKDVVTLNSQKTASGGKFPPDKEELLNKMLTQKQKLTNRFNEVSLELEELKAYINMLDQKGVVNAEKTMYPGVEINIKDQKFRITDSYNHVRVTLEGNDWKFSDYVAPEGFENKNVIRQRGR